MYHYEERMRAVDLYIKLGKCGFRKNRTVISLSRGQFGGGWPLRYCNLSVVMISGF
jgi:hypothetical protein